MHPRRPDHLPPASAAAPPPPPAPAAASPARPREEGLFRVLLVCTANHCRSPLAEALLRRRIEDAGLADRVSVESAALRQTKVGEPPSASMLAAAHRRGLALAGRATWASPARIAAADLVVCMDHHHAEEIRRDLGLGDRAVAAAAIDRVRLLLEYAPDCGRDEVPDPHGLDADAHERVAELIEQGVDGLARAIGSMLADPDR